MHKTEPTTRCSTRSSPSWRRANWVPPHSGVLGLFDREFVKPGLLPRELSRSLRLAFNRRQSWDYGEMGDLDPEEVTDMVAEAKLFVQAIEEFLRPEQ